jgi:hypothetical protein
MRNLPLVAFVLLLSLCSNNLFAQSSSNSTESNLVNSIIKYSNNGKLNYSYRKLANNNFIVEVIFKNDQSIYKQEIDTLQIHSAEAFTLLKQDLQNALTALQNVNPNFKIQRPNYLLVVEDKGVAGLFMVLSNPIGTINTANTKFQIRVLLEWLNTIEFGKS